MVRNLIAANRNGKKGIAGFEWVMCFMKLHPHLSLKKPESTHLARSTGFNHHNVTEFTIQGTACTVEIHW
jgi:hypothetical protein